MVDKEVDRQVYFERLTNSEKEIYAYLKDEFLTISQIANRRKCTRQAISKLIISLKKKGYINKDLKVVNQNECACQPSGKIRVHGVEVNIEILYKDNRYHQIKNKSNLIFINGDTIRLYANSIEIYINKSFYSNFVNNAYFDTLSYINRLITRLESDLKVLLIKDRSQNIKIVKTHISDTNNELAKDYEARGDKFHIYATEDGKLWGLIDDSFDLNELETVHTETHKKDMEQVIVPFFNDLRDKKPPILSEMYNLIYMQNNIIDGVLENQQRFDANMQSHIKAVQKLGEGVEQFNKKIGELISLLGKKS